MEHNIKHRSDGRWEVRYTDQCNKRHSKYFRTRKEARDFLPMIPQIIADTGNDVKSMALGEWAVRCLEIHGEELQDASYVSYDSRIRCHILADEIAGADVGKITWDAVKAWITRCRVTDRSGNKKAPSAKTQKELKGLMSWLLNHATDDGVIPNRVDLSRVKVDSQTKPMRKVLTPEQGIQALEAAKGHPYEIAFRIALETGCRRSELLAVSWDAFDSRAFSIAIQGKVTVDRDTGRPMLSQDGKTENARRTIPISDELTQALVKYRRAWERERTAAGALWMDGSNLIIHDGTGRPVHPDALSSAWKKVQIRAGLEPVGLNGYRHLFATTLIRAGIDDVTIADAMGHYSANFTRQQYADVYQQDRRRISDAITGLRRNMGSNWGQDSAEGKENPLNSRGI